MVWPCLKVFWFSKANPTGHSERKKKKRQTEEEVGRQYQRVDRNGLCHLGQLGQLKTGQDGKGLLRIHLWCPDDLPRLWDRIEIEIESKFTNQRMVEKQGSSLTYIINKC